MHTILDVSDKQDEPRRGRRGPRRVFLAQEDVDLVLRIRQVHETRGLHGLRRGGEIL